jgi:hypothetical protein
MSAIFDFSSVLMILLLMICTCTYLREMKPNVFDGGSERDDSQPVHINRDGKTHDLLFLFDCFSCTL